MVRYGGRLLLFCGTGYGNRGSKIKDMKDEQLNRWCFNPVNLSKQEIHDPFMVISDFFSSDDVPGHLRELLTWRNCIIADRYYVDRKGSPSGLLFTHKLNVKLVEAMYLLLQVNWSKIMMITAIHHSGLLSEEKNTWPYFPDMLNEEELLNPFLVIKAFFNDYTLPQYRDFLYEWLEHGLSSNAAAEFIETADLIKVYENLQKLYAAAWLIHQRTSNHPYLKRKRYQKNR